jgi:hypothetical protein
MLSRLRNRLARLEEVLQPEGRLLCSSTTTREERRRAYTTENGVTPNDKLLAITVTYED